MHINAIWMWNINTSLTMRNNSLYTYADNYKHIFSHPNYKNIFGQIDDKNFNLNKFVVSFKLIFSGNEWIFFRLHDDVIKWKQFPRYWPFVRGIHRSRWIPRTKASDADLWCFFFIYAWMNGWVNNGEAGDLRRHRAHYDVTVMYIIMLWRSLLSLLTWRPVI